MRDMSVVSSCIYYLGGAFIIFLFHVEDKNFFPTSFLCSGASKLWFAISSLQQVSFENFVASKVYGRQYVNDHNGGVRQIIATKILCLTLHIQLALNRA